jgi:autotransporter-associated beta strand protein
VVSGPISNGNATYGTVIKTGNGKVTLQGNHTYTGSTSVLAGTFEVDGNTAVGNDFYIGANGTLSGSGDIGGQVFVAGTLSPGNSPGTLETGSQGWLEDGAYNWQVLDATGAAGTGYDTVSITGVLDLSMLGTGDFDINLWSLSSIGPDVNGNASNFVNSNSYSWTLVSTTDGIVGFQAADFVIHTAANNGTGGFTNTLDGSFSISQSGNNLLLNYTPIPEPATGLMLILVGGACFLARRRRRE